MSIAAIVTEGFGSFGTVNLVVTEGFLPAAVAAPAPNTTGGHLVAGWFSKKRWHNLKRDLEEQERLEALHAERLDRLERELEAKIDAERPFSRKKLAQLKAERAKAIELENERLALDQRIAEAERQEARDAAHADLVRKLGEEEAQTRETIRALQAHTLNSVLMRQRLAEQERQHAELLRQMHEDAEDEEALLFWVTHH